MSSGTEDASLFCARCALELRPGTGNHYRVLIEATADPAPPDLERDDPERLRLQIQAVLQELEGVSEREAMDQVHRRLVLYLCSRCYRDWIEDPVGSR